MKKLIYLEDAIEALKGLLGSMLETDTIGFYEIENVLYEVPSAQPEQQWIPCSERLPDKDGRYLITGIKGTVYSLDYEDGRWYGGIRPVAWMPLSDLPEPYLEPTCNEDSCPIRYKEDEQ